MLGSRSSVVRLRTGAKELVRRRLAAVGLIVHRAGQEVGLEDRRRTLLNQASVDTVLDIGANAGQYGQILRLQGYERRIVSFEPNPMAYDRLVACSQADPAWEARCLGLSGSGGERWLHVSENLQSSSILPMLGRHEKAAPLSVYFADERIETVTLASAVGEYGGPDASVFLKLDTQGTELEILQSGGDLEGVVGVQVETSLTSLYEGQALIEEILTHLRNKGLTPVAVSPGLADPTSGDLLQVDLLAVRTGVR
jgi:FkbM family methyltransferase